MSPPDPDGMEEREPAASGEESAEAGGTPEPDEKPRGLRTAKEGDGTGSPADRPSWLVGADEALDAEQTGQQPDPARPHVPIPPPRAVAPPTVNPYANMSRQGDDFALGASWRETGYGAGAGGWKPPPASATPAASPARAEPEEPAGPEPDDDLAGPETPDAIAERAQAPPPPPPPGPWQRALDLATSPGGLIGIGVVLVAIVTVSLAGHHEKGSGVAIAAIHRNSSQWDGREVHVHGRVGDEVYPMGGGYAFYLLQGHDTLVVFTRSRTPVPHQSLSISGVVSTGYLGGQARPSLLESTP